MGQFLKVIRQSKTVYLETLQVALVKRVKFYLRKFQCSNSEEPALNGEKQSKKSLIVFKDLFVKTIKICGTRKPITRVLFVKEVLNFCNIKKVGVLDVLRTLVQLM